MKWTGAQLILSGVLLAAQSGSAQQMAALKGEKVILFAKAKAYTCAPFGCNYFGAVTYEKPNRNLTQDYDARTGSVLEAMMVDYSENGMFMERVPEVIVALDGSGEKVIVRDIAHFGFFAEKRLAEAFVGRTLWTKGRVYLDDPNKALPPLTKLQATQARWGTYDEPIVLTLKADDGREGGFGFGLRRCLDTRFHRFCEKPWEVGDDFLMADPHTLYPRWSADAWKLVTMGMVAIGMTEDMVKAVCGSSLRLAGAVLSDAGKASSIFSCTSSDGPFLLENGKVTKFVNR